MLTPESRLIRKSSASSTTTRRLKAGASTSSGGEANDSGVKVPVRLGFRQSRDFSVQSQTPFIPNTSKVQPLNQENLKRLSRGAELSGANDSSEYSVDAADRATSTRNKNQSAKRNSLTLTEEIEERRRRAEEIWAREEKMRDAF